MERREYLQGLAAAGATATVAGCTFWGPGPGDDGDDPYVPTEPNYQGWFENVSNYRGTVDARGRSEYEIDVGIQGANGFYYFGPAAVAVSPGTEVTWRWAGKGGTHNVLSTSGAFTSGQLIDRKGYTFTNTFDNPGVYRYLCSPHQSLGMKGAVFVTLGQPGEPT